MSDLSIDVAGEKLTLLPERAVCWPREKSLLIADPHWGKAATFRASGIPVPSGTTADAIHRLTSLIQRTGAERVIFLGDLLHAKEGRSDSMFAALRDWRRTHQSTEVLLVRGNHDRRAGDPPGDLQFDCVNAPFVAPPFVFAHHPAVHEEGYVLAGHVHPAIRVYGRARQSARLPCFVFGDRAGILPAFGDFSGLGDVDPVDGDRIYGIAQDSVIEIALQP
jgi:DNA ligase-associated metallophosphoesterase